MGKMTIQEIAKILVEKNKLTAKEANQFAATMFEIIQQRLNDEELVKIKGLGTFKMIRVEARESVSVRTGERVMIDSHAKITFTPDATMKELVNKPFSQFETVILNEGVEFEDLSDDLTEEELAEADTIDEQPVTVVETPIVEEKVEETVEEKPQEIIEEKPEEVIEEKVEESVMMQPLMEVVDEAPLEKQEEETTSQVEEEEEEKEEPVYIEDDESSSWKKTLGYILLTLALMAASAYGGYWYGQHEDSFFPAKEMPTTAPDVIVADSIEDLSTDTTATAIETLSETERPAPESKKEESKTEDPKKEEVKKDSSEEPDWKKYEAMDARVRTGAYHIVGTDHEVKARKGETLSRIARRELGEGMSCYMEVYNNMKPDTELKEGQVVKVPKLKWKKKRM